MADDITGLVYYVLSASRREQLVKIGYSRSLHSRLNSLREQALGRSVVLIALEPGSLDLEHERHRQFSDLRQHGEWFTFGDDLQRWVSNLQNPAALILDRSDLWVYAQGISWSVPRVPPRTGDPYVDLDPGSDTDPESITEVVEF